MISKKNLTQLIGRFRDICFAQYQNDIDTVSQDKRSTRLRNSEPNWSSILRTSIMPEPIDDIVRLAKTPRLLKLILRRIYRVWETLHGEIDFDDLLIANVLRYAAPEAFNFIMENVQEIRGLETEGVLKDLESRLKAVEMKWDWITQNVQWDSTSAKHLVQFLFPCWNNKRFQIHPSLQTVQIESPTDYWERLLLEELPPDTISDQEVLHSLVCWKEEPLGHHIQGRTVPMALACSKEYAEKFEHLSLRILDGNDIRLLAAALFKEGLSIHGVSACCDEIPGFINLWRRAISKPIEEKEHMDWVRQQVAIILPISLRFANDVYYYWRSNCQSDIYHKGNKRDLRSEIVSFAQKLFSHSPETFLKIIDPHYMYSSYHFCVYYSEPEQGGTGFRPGEWRWYANLLLEAGKIDAQTIIPQIACLVVDENSTPPGFTYKFRKEWAEELFKGTIIELMKILATDIQLRNFDEREKARIKCAQEEASDWLKAEKALYDE